MDPQKIEALLREVREGRTEVAEALERLRGMPFEDLGFAKLDHHRGLRTGMPEVIFASGKTPAQVAQIFARMAAAGGNVLATRVSGECMKAVLEAEPRATFHEAARAASRWSRRPRRRAKARWPWSAPEPATCPLRKKPP